MAANPENSPGCLFFVPQLPERCKHGRIGTKRANHGRGITGEGFVAFILHHEKLSPACTISGGFKNITNGSNHLNWLVACPIFCTSEIVRVTQRRLWCENAQRQIPLWKTTATVLRAWLAIRGVVPTSEVFLNARGEPFSR